MPTVPVTQEQAPTLDQLMPEATAFTPSAPQAAPVIEPEPLAQPALPTADEFFSDPAPVAPPEQATGVPVPQALVDRMNVTSSELWQAMTRIAGEFGKGAGGDRPLGFTEEQLKTLRKYGLARDGEGGPAAPLRLFNEVLLNGTASLVDGFLRVIGGGIHGIGQLGAEVSSATGGTETDAARTKRELINAMNFAMVEMGRGPNLHTPRANRVGAIDDVPLGDLPRSSAEFPAAREVVIREADAAADAAVRRTYEERGVTPQEIVADAKHDVTVAQDLAEGRVPAIYGGEKLPAVEAVEMNVAGGAKTEGALVRKGQEVAREEPPMMAEPPAEPPKLPPPEGSFDAAYDAIHNKINFKGVDATRPMTFDRLYTALIDDLNPINTATKKALKTLGYEGELPVAENPYSLARLTRGTFGKAHQFLNIAPFNFKTYANEGTSFKSIVEPFAKNGELEPLATYLTARRVVELENRGVKSGFDVEAAARVVKELSGKYEVAHRALVSFQNKTLQYLRDSGIVSQKGFEKMVEANKAYVPFYRWFDPEYAQQAMKGKGSGGRKLQPRDPLEVIDGSDLGIVNPLESIVKNTYVYVALAEKNAVAKELITLLEKADRGATFTRSLLEQPKPAGKAPPPERPALPAPKQGELMPPERPALPAPERGAVEQRWRGTEIAKPERMIQEEMGRPVIDAEWVDVLAKAGIKDDELAALITTNASKPIGDRISYFQNGVQRTYKVSDPDLVDAFRGLDRYTATFVQKLLSIPAGTLRSGAVLAPEFSLRGVLRDFQSAFLNSKGGLFSPHHTISGAKSLLGKDQSFEAWLKGGGANATLVALDRNYIRENVLKLTGAKSASELVWNVAASPYRSLRAFSELVENATRLGEFKKQMAGKEPTKANIQSAAMESREVTVDFSRVGAQMRAYSMITAFANPNIQGLDRTLRAFKDRPVATSTRVALGITLPSVLLWWANKDKEAYKELSAFRKDFFFNFIIGDGKDATVISIPKLFETGVVFGSGVERALDKYVQENPDAMKGFDKSVMEALVPPFIPTGIAPIAEHAANRSLLTGEKLIPRYLEDQLPAYRYTPYTTETAKALGRIFGAMPAIGNDGSNRSSATMGVSEAISTPILLENYLRGWTGGLGMHALRLVDAIGRNTGALNNPVAPEKDLIELPILRSFGARFPAANAASIENFYDRNEQHKQVRNTLRARAAAGDIDAVQEIMDSERSWVTLDQLQTTLGEHARMVRGIHEDKEMTPKDKRQLIDTIYYNMIQMARQGNEILRQAEAKDSLPTGDEFFR